MRLHLTVIAAIAALAFAGCGGDDEPQPLADIGATGASGASGASGVPGRAEFIKTADAICAEGEASERDQIAELFPNVAGPDDLSAAQYEQLATEIVVPSLQSQLDQLRALTPPEGDEDAFDAITSGLAEGIAETEGDPSTLAEGGGPNLQEASKLALDYGLKECGS